MIGVPIMTSPSIVLDVPRGFDSMHQHENMVSFSYSATEDDERLIYLIASTIREGEVGGPVGGWKVLSETSKNGITVYYYESSVDEGLYLAEVRNRTQENNPFGTLRYLTLGALGVSEDEFLAIIGSIRPRNGR